MFSSEIPKHMQVFWCILELQVNYAEREHAKVLRDEVTEDLTGQCSNLYFFDGKGMVWLHHDNLDRREQTPKTIYCIFFHHLWNIGSVFFPSRKFHVAKRPGENVNTTVKSTDGVALRVLIRCDFWWVEKHLGAEGNRMSILRIPWKKRGKRNYWYLQIYQQPYMITISSKTEFSQRVPIK